MTTFVKVTRADGEGTVQLLNLDHVLLLEQRERGTVVAFADPTTLQITVLESVDELLGHTPRAVPSYTHRVGLIHPFKLGDWVQTNGTHRVGCIDSLHHNWAIVQFGSGGPFQREFFDDIMPATPEQIAIMEGTSK